MKKKAVEEDIREGRYVVPALYRGMKLLEMLSEHPEGLTMSGMMSLNLPQATLYRMLMTLQQSGYVIRDSDETFRVSRKMLSLGCKAIDDTGLLEKSRSPMRRLRDLCGETVLTAVLYAGEGVVLDQVESVHAVKVTIRLGHHFPLHSAAPGKAILARLPECELKELLGRMTFTRFTEQTITDLSDFMTELEKVRAEGVAYDCGEEIEDLRCVGAPVLDRAGYPVSAVWITGPSSRINNMKLKKYAALVKECADEISEKL